MVPSTQNRSPLQWGQYRSVAQCQTGKPKSNCLDAAHGPAGKNGDFYYSQKKYRFWTAVEERKRWTLITPYDEQFKDTTGSEILFYAWLNYTESPVLQHKL